MPALTSYLVCVHFLVQTITCGHSCKILIHISSQVIYALRWSNGIKYWNALCMYMFIRQRQSNILWHHKTKSMITSDVKGAVYMRQRHNGRGEARHRRPRLRQGRLLKAEARHSENHVHIIMIITRNNTLSNDHFSNLVLVLTSIVFKSCPETR